ncbi:MAG: hypothetical protein LBM41_06640 [Ruminococcus sp.]|jgi:flagellar basal body-associated protein FliL|nr:hypothetical protein [Ruminococcus sp.]
MQTKFIVIIIVCVIAVIGIAVILVMFRKKMNAQRIELEEIVKRAAVFVAVVESIPEKNTPVLIFRNAENNATIIHKYKSFGLRKYDAGEVVQLLYLETEDKYFIADDNEYYKKMFDTARNSMILTLIIPIVMMIVAMLLLTN